MTERNKMKVFSLKKMIEHQPVLKELNETLKLYMEDDGRQVNYRGGLYVDYEGKVWNSKYVVDKKEWEKYEITKGGNI